MNTTTLDRKAIFNTVLEALRIQGKASVDVTNGCAYRGDDGTKCAVGHLITEEYYDAVLEGSRVGAPEILKALGLSLGIPSLAEYITGTEVGFLSCLQKAHDNTLRNKGIDEWESTMERIKEVYL